MKKLLALVLACMLVASLFVGCTAAPAEPEKAPAAEPEKVTEAETVVDEPKELITDPDLMTAEDWENLKNETRTLKIDLIPGYLTDELWDIYLEGFKRDHPNWTIELNINAESAANQQAEILNGNNPVFFQSTSNFTGQQAMEAGIIRSMEPLLDAPAYDAEGLTVRETLLPGYDKASMWEGESVSVPYRFGGNGVWYNSKMFEENGWEVPTTWDELLDVCAKIKEKGIIPISWTGTFAPYLFTDLLYPRIVALGEGRQTWVDMHNLKDGAWSNDVVRQAIEDIQQLFDLGYLPESGLGTDYLLAQQIFFEDKCAMVLCGTWFESEMKDSIPEGYEFKFMAPPVLENEDDTAYISVFVGSWALCKDSGYEVEAMEFVRYFMSNEFMAAYAEKMGEPVITQNAVELDPSKFTMAGYSIYETFNAPNSDLMFADMSAWYAEFYNNFCNGVVGILAGNETLDNLLANTESAMQAVKADDSILKFTME